MAMTRQQWERELRRRQQQSFKKWIEEQKRRERELRDQMLRDIAGFEKILEDLARAAGLPPKPRGGKGRKGR